VGNGSGHKTVSEQEHAQGQQRHKDERQNDSLAGGCPKQHSNYHCAQPNADAGWPDRERPPPSAEDQPRCCGSRKERPSREEDPGQDIPAFMCLAAYGRKQKNKQAICGGRC
jgi:hypothetical protein